MARVVARVVAGLRRGRNPSGSDRPALLPHQALGAQALVVVIRQAGKLGAALAALVVLERAGGQGGRVDAESQAGLDAARARRYAR